MFDFRYHALSLAAVFIALVVGLLLGVAIGDKELVSSARAGPARLAARRRARGRPGARRGQGAAARAGAVRRRRLPDPHRRPAARPAHRARRCWATTTARRTSSARRSSRRAPTCRSSRSCASDVDLAALAERARGTRYANLAAIPTLLDDLGKRRRHPDGAGGRLVGELRSAAPADAQRRASAASTASSSCAARAKPAEDRTVAERLRRAAGRHRPRPRADRRQGRRRRAARRRAVARSAGFATASCRRVDNIDERPGEAALVFVLAGAQGAYGRRDGAQALLPPVVGRAALTRRPDRRRSSARPR